MRLQCLGLVLIALVSTAGLATAQHATTDSETAALIAEAARALESNDLERAEALFLELLRQTPPLATGALGLAEVWARRQDPVTALGYARRAEQIEPRSKEAALATGRLLARLGKTEPALAALTRVRELAPKDLDAIMLSALVLRDAGRGDEAIELLEGAQRSGVRAPEIAEELGLLHLAAGSPERAKQVAQAALSDHPQRARLHLVVGLALAAEEQVAPARASLERSLAAGIDDPGRVHLELGRLLLDAEEPDAAIPHLRQAAELLPQSASAAYLLATSLRTSGDSVGARIAIEHFQVLKRRQDDAETTAKEVGTALNEAQTLANDNHLPEALDALDQLLAEHPRLARAELLRGKVLFSMGRLETALGSVTRARELSPGRVEPNYLEGVFLMRLGRPQEAITALERSVALDPTLGGAFALLGGAAAKLDMPDEAVRHFARALELGADSPSVRLGYAAVLETLGRTTESDTQMRAYRDLVDN